MMIRMIKAWRGRKGQGLTEYALILGLIVGVAVAAFAIFGDQIKAVFGNIAAKVGTEAMKDRG